MTEHGGGGRGGHWNTVSRQSAVALCPLPPAILQLLDPKQPNRYTVMLLSTTHYTNHTVSSSHTPRYNTCPDHEQQQQQQQQQRSSTHHQATTLSTKPPSSSSSNQPQHSSSMSDLDEDLLVVAGKAGGKKGKGKRARSDSDDDEEWDDDDDDYQDSEDERKPAKKRAPAGRGRASKQVRAVVRVADAFCLLPHAAAPACCR